MCRLGQGEAREWSAVARRSHRGADRADIFFRFRVRLALPKMEVASQILTVLRRVWNTPALGVDTKCTEHTTTPASALYPALISGSRRPQLRAQLPIEDRRSCPVPGDTYQTQTPLRKGRPAMGAASRAGPCPHQSSHTPSRILRLERQWSKYYAIRPSWTEGVRRSISACGV